MKRIAARQCRTYLHQRRATMLHPFAVAIEKIRSYLIRQYYGHLQQEGGLLAVEANVSLSFMWSYVRFFPAGREYITSRYLPHLICPFELVYRTRNTEYTRIHSLPDNSNELPRHELERWDCQQITGSYGQCECCQGSPRCTQIQSRCVSRSLVIKPIEVSITRTVLFITCTWDHKIHGN